MSLPLKIHGGKQYLAKKILALFPPRDSYTHYVEPYFGGGAVLFNHDPEGKSEVVNDINTELANFWAVLREPQWHDLFQRLQYTECGEMAWEEALCDTAPRDSIMRAWAFFVRYRQSRQGLGKCFNTLSRTRTRRGMNEQASSWLGAVESLVEAHKRLQRVVVLCRDALDVIRQQDGPETVFFCDPPYLHSTRKATSCYDHEMSDDQHEAMLQTLSGIRGRFMLSGYMNELYHAYAIRHAWSRTEFRIDNKASGSKRKEIKTECVWRNYI